MGSVHTVDLAPVDAVEKEIVSVRSYLFKNSETYYWFDECRGILIV